MVGIYLPGVYNTLLYAATSPKTNQVPGTTDIINHPHPDHQLTSSSSCSRSLLLVVVGVAVVAVGAAGSVGGGGGHLYVAVVLVVKFYLVCTGHQVQGICVTRID